MANLSTEVSEACQRSASKQLPQLKSPFCLQQGVAIIDFRYERIFKFIYIQNIATGETSPAITPYHTFHSHFASLLYAALALAFYFELLWTITTDFDVSSV